MIFKQTISEFSQSLAKAMMDSVYPKLFELMNLCHIKEIEIKNPGWIPIVFNADDQTVSFHPPSLNQKRVFSCNSNVNKFCIFSHNLMDIPDDIESFKKQESKIQKTLSFYKMIFNKIEELESYFKDIEYMTNKAKKFQFYFQKEVLIEKYQEEVENS